LASSRQLSEQCRQSFSAERAAQMGSAPRVCGRCPCRPLSIPGLGIRASIGAPALRRPARRRRDTSAYPNNFASRFTLRFLRRRTV
jgi:hypothetical protein